ncbi:hypothetical protein [Thalassospira australica]|uniref:hypothetical protein n=1 Tax=Thalassospira australica TaxID=1528106 RepID=UPI00051A2C8C|nr:hypothetical protein [Thalassospira australica]
MVNLTSSSDLQNTLPVRPTSPIAQRQQSEQQQVQQDQYVDGNSRARQTSDQEAERAVRAFERDRNEQRQFISDGTQETVLENYVEQFDPVGYGANGSANATASNTAGGRGQVVDFLA